VIDYRLPSFGDISTPRRGLFPQWRQKVRKHIARARMIAMFILSLPICSTVVLAGALEDGQAAYNRGDYATAVALFRPLAEQGNADAQNNLGWMYDQGSGVKQDFKEAMKWYRLAAEQGAARAEYSLGVLYYNGRGVPKNLQDAVKWYRMAAAQGDPKAQYNLGFMYANGEGVPKNLPRGYMWWSLSSNNGEAAAWASLNALSKMMTAEQIAEAQTMARNCEASNYKKCI
jgi:TPR repeat protein